MPYRAIKMKNGGEEVEFRHFETLVGAYTWLIPSEEVYDCEHWSLKPYPEVLDLCKKWDTSKGQDCIMELVGWNEMEKETSVYIQRVSNWQDALPKF
jgi:hypothetical protein